jgi:hypothetical protein
MVCPRLGVFLGVALALAFGGFTGRALAQAPSLGSSSGACGTENLLAGRKPSQWQDVRGSLELPTDGAAAPEGAQWDAPVAITFDTPAGSLTYDLGQVQPVSAFYLQADATDTY